jgi:hypothetical protein
MMNKSDASANHIFAKLHVLFLCEKNNLEMEIAI